MPDREMHQVAPFPEALRLLVARLEYRPGWEFSLADTDRGQGCAGLTLDVHISSTDALRPENGGYVYRAHHKLPVPPFNWTETGWLRWLYDQCLSIEEHECREFFRVDGERPFAPQHGFRGQPYAGVV